MRPVSPLAPATTLALALALALPADAQEDLGALDGCDVAEDEYTDILYVVLHGAWQVRHGPGTMLIEAPQGSTAMAIPPDGEVQSAEFVYDDGRLLVAAGMGMNFLEVQTTSPSDHGEYGLGDEGAMQVMDFELIESLGQVPPNCSFDITPTLTYTGPIEDEAGNSVPGSFEVILHYVNESLMSGVLIMNMPAEGGAQIHARRFITFSR